MVFTGAADQSTLDALYALTPPQPPVRPYPPADGSNMPAVPPFQAALLDSDVQTLQIIVEAKAPTFDTGTPSNLMADADTPPSPGQSSTTPSASSTTGRSTSPRSPLPSPSVRQHTHPTHAPCLNTPMSQIDSPVLPSAALPTILPIPTGRDIRIRLRGLGADDPGNLYYGNSIARTGLTSDIRVRYEAATETEVILTGNLDQQLQAFTTCADLDNSNQQEIVTLGVVEAILTGGGKLRLSRPTKTLASTLNTTPSTPIQLLASALSLPLTGQTISAPPGHRILFGAQSTLRHTLPQDRSSITFSTQKDLINHWIVVHRLTLDRDWTWSGLAQSGPNQIGFDFQGITYPAGTLQPALPGPRHHQSTQRRLQPGHATKRQSRSARQHRDHLLLHHRFHRRPRRLSLARRRRLSTPSPPSPAAPTTPVQLWQGQIEVPITVNPRQIPTLVSAGIAESAYQPSADYSSTNIRQRSPLAFEFAQPPPDPNDAYFVREMNDGPDPLLMSTPVDLPESPDTPISLDPEPIRTITPDSVNDSAGLSAMTQVKPSASSHVHFLIPLPSAISPEALDLFGFWTYEIRCGHLQWSTAQGRFGRPLRVAGVQHPCRHLIATVDRSKTVPSGGGASQPCIVASADLAQTVLNGQSLTSASNPQTQIWFLLYAQLRRADGQAYRNLLLSKLLGQFPQNPAGTNLAGPAFNIAQVQSLTVDAAFSQSAIDTILADLLLPANTPLSVLAVELFNLEYLVTRDPAGGATTLALSPALANTKLAATATLELATPQAALAEQVIGDPLGDQLGSQRILRVSPLPPVEPVC